jgi:trehalose-6-phosphate synthase
VATQVEKGGALILSEFAGAAQSMDGAFIVNPWNIDELVEAYREALTTSPNVATSNHQKLFKYVTKQTASYWGQSFVSELQVFCIIDCITMLETRNSRAHFTTKNKADC